MSAPNRTTFEVKVGNLLKNENAFVQLQSTLRYVQTLSSTNFVHNLSNNYGQHSYLNAKAKSTKDAYSKANSNEFYTETKSSLSGTNNSTTNHDASLSGSGHGIEVGGNYSYASTQDSSHSKSNHNIDSGKSASALSTNNQLSNATTDISNKIKSNKLENTNKSSLQSSSINKIVQPGFARIVPGQTLSIPVVVERESQVVYLSVYISNDKQYSHKCIANQLQINVQHIQIVEFNGTIAIKPMIKENVGFRKLLQKWNIPESLIDCMEQCGWTEPRSWDNIRPIHLEKMGFKAGHVDKFNNGYKQWKKMKNWLYNDITYKALFELWSLPNYLYDNLINDGWHDINFWSHLIDNDEHLKELGFKQGHIVIFKHNVKDNKHLKIWDKIKQEFEKNKENHEDSKYDDDCEFDSKPQNPQFNIINITHNCAHVELLNIIKSNEYYRIELCEKHDNDNDQIWNHILTIKKGQKHKIKLDKMDTVYLIRIRSRNHQLDTTSDYTIKSFKTQNKQWMINNVKDIKNFDYKIDLIHEKKVEFILIQFNENHISNLNKDNVNNNKYFIEIAKELDDSMNDEKEMDKLEWNKILQINDKQTKYIIHCDVILNKKYYVRIKSINNFEYIQYEKKYKIIQIVQQQYHPFGCRVQYEHSGTEWYHPKSPKKFSCCPSCGKVGTLIPYDGLRLCRDSARQSLAIAICSGCQTQQFAYGENIMFQISNNKKPEISKNVYQCCLQESSSGCKERYRCCKSDRLTQRGCKTVYYHNCCNQRQHTKGCSQKYVCKQL